MANTTYIALEKLGATSKLKDFPVLFNNDMDIIDSSLGYGFGQNSNPTVKASIDAVSSRLVSDFSIPQSVSNDPKTIAAYICGITTTLLPNNMQSKTFSFVKEGNDYGTVMLTRAYANVQGIMQWKCADQKVYTFTGTTSGTCSLFQTIDNRATYVSPDSLAAFKSSLLEIANGMDIMESKTVSYYMNGTVEGFETGRNYSGVVRISYKDSERLYFDVVLSSYTGDIVVVGYDYGTWHINPIYTNMYSNYLTFDGTRFPVSVPPKGNGQLVLVARNANTGALYVLWYNSLNTAFEIAKTLDGSAPQSGHTVWVQYLV